MSRLSFILSINGRHGNYENHQHDTYENHQYGKYKHQHDIWGNDQYGVDENLQRRRVNAQEYWSRLSACIEVHYTKR